MGDRGSCFWGVVLLFVVLLIVFIIVIVYLARNSAIPIDAGSIDSGVVASRTLSHRKPVEDEYKLVAVIVEPREKNLIETISHYMRTLPEYTHFQVYHGTKNHEFLLNSSLRPHIDSGKVELLDMGVENLTVMGYCELLCSVDFWNTIRSEKVLIFQTDSITCARSKYDIEEFLEYDYVGAPLPAQINMLMRTVFWLRGWNISTDFYNGGLSVRTKSLSKEVIEKYPWDKKTPEDVWFCAFMDKLGGKVANYDVAKKFSYEATSNFEEVPWGLHKPRKNERKLQQYCPEYKNIPFIPAYTDYKTLYMV